MALILPVTEETDNCEIHLVKNTGSLLEISSIGNTIDNTFDSSWLPGNITMRDTDVAAAAANNDESTIEDSTYNFVVTGTFSI